MSHSPAVAIWFLALWCTVRSITDEYFITNINTSFSNITCNRLKNCYIRCKEPGSCSNAVIRCNSPICDISCTTESCVNTTITIDQSATSQPNYATLNCTGAGSCRKLNLIATGSQLPLTVSSTLTEDGKPAFDDANIAIKEYSSVDIRNTDAGHEITCYHTGSCLATTYTVDSVDDLRISQHSVDDLRSFYDFTIIDSLRINVTCLGSGSCSENSIAVTHKTSYNSSMVVDCRGNGACWHINISVTAGDKLNMFCVEGDKNICLGATLSVSPFFDHTHLMCNGAYASGSCNDLLIIVPHNPAFLFLHHTFVNEAEDDNLPYAGSLDRVRIVCSQQELCTDWTSFPLLYDAVPDINEANTSLYFFGNYSYNYLFKRILCESGKECFIDCKNSASCGSSFVECEEGSKCHIDCSDSYQCDNMVVKAYGEIDLYCGSLYACNAAKLWLPKTNQKVNVSSANNGELSLIFLCGNGTFGAYDIDSNGKTICEDAECCPSFTKASSGDKKKTSAGVIVLIVICIILVIVGVVGAVYWMNKRKKEQEPYVQMEDPLMS